VFKTVFKLSHFAVHALQHRYQSLTLFQFHFVSAVVIVVSALSSASRSTCRLPSNLANWHVTYVI